MDNVQKAEIASLVFQRRAVEKGLIVSKPLLEAGARYDFVLDEDGKLRRVQVKWCDCTPTNSKGVVQVSLATQGHKKKIPYYTDTEIDLVMVYIPRANKLIQLLPAMFSKKSSVTLRLEPPKNNQRKGVHLIDDYVW